MDKHPSQRGVGGVARCFMLQKPGKAPAVWVTCGSRGTRVARVGHLWLVWVTYGSCGSPVTVCDFTKSNSDLTLIPMLKRIFIIFSHNPVFTWFCFYN